ncbi:MAG: aldo/keto reductase [Verrucomicrobiota bacterium]|nr:aldo/keto reductase [Verrucomicrobiota bacterium]
MEPTRTGYGTWSGGRFMHFGEKLDERRYLDVIRLAYEKGIRTFMTADVYGNGESDLLLGKALSDVKRDSWCLVGAVGHDFYKGKREGAKGYPRFTNKELRPASEFKDYLSMATEKSLERCGTTHFDLLLLHNPDSVGYSSDIVWSGMNRLKEKGLTRQLGVAPGPANGFTLDLILCMERFEEVLDWAMIILNPLEPWPGNMALPAAEKHQVKLITRVVDYGGIFHDDVKPGHQFGPQDHRAFRPAGWVEAGNEKMNRMREIAQAHGLTMLQLACIWNLSQEPVRSVIPTLIQEGGSNSKAIEEKVDELAQLPEIKLSRDEVKTIEEIGNNRGCMSLKGGNRSHTSEPVADQWSLTADLEAVAQRWGIDADKDLACTHSMATKE